MVLAGGMHGVALSIRCRHLARTGNARFWTEPRCACVADEHEGLPSNAWGAAMVRPFRLLLHPCHLLLVPVHLLLPLHLLPLLTDVASSPAGII